MLCLRQVMYLTFIAGRVLPAVEKELGIYRRKLRECPAPELRRQALASIRDKRFHAQGGAVYAALAPSRMHDLTRAIVSLQTVSDYLDNLCDRAGVTGEDAFRQLHLAMFDAVQPGRSTRAYYKYFPCSDDGGYLPYLVQRCRSAVQAFPGFHQAADYATGFIRLYSELQTYKHLGLAVREARLKEWAVNARVSYPGLRWWEFAAATGSTLGIFALFAITSAGRPSRRAISDLINAYFPWVCGLHILLDYFIDQNEDRDERDLNLVSYYPSEDQKRDRLLLFATEARARAGRLPNFPFHQMVVDGLLAMYLTDPKAYLPDNAEIASSLLNSGGRGLRILSRLCSSLRRVGVL